MDNGHLDEDAPIQILAESERFAVLLAQDADGENIYNIELGTATLHLFEDEWQELVQLIRDATG